jgi:transposase
MNTPIPEIRKSALGRRHARYSHEFRRQVVAACQAPGVSKDAIALANGLNANMLRRWLVEATQGRDGQLSAVKEPLRPAQIKPDFIPINFTPGPSIPAPDIRIELQHAGISIQIHWPLAASNQCAQWVREVLA